MNEFAKSSPLIIGIGNPLRGDDGLGRMVAEQWQRGAGADCDVVMVHQLTPELALNLAAARSVVVVDASVEGVPGEIQTRSILPASQSGAMGTHRYGPAELAALAHALYGHCPPLLAITVTGVNFDLGERITAVVAEQVPVVLAIIRNYLDA